MNKQIKKVCIVVLALVSLLCLAMPAMAETNAAKTDCPVRVSPDDNSTIIGMLSAGDHVTVNFAQGAWLDITFANGTGYVRSEYMIPVINNVVPVISQPVPVIPQTTPVPVIQQPRL